jgi:hypothetical protein
MRLPRPSLSPLLPLLIALAVLPHGAHANSIPLRLIADPAGENDGDSFGVSVASVGDLNGEGYDDLLVGANYYPTLSGRGRAYVYFGGHAPDAVPDRVFTGAASGDQLGSVVGSAGDVNGDGFPDVFAVASYNDAGGTDAGAVYVWFGGPAFDTTADLTILGS